MKCNPKLSSAERETVLRRRSEHFRVLQAIAEMVPGDNDADGRAKGCLTVRQLTAHAGVSGKAVDRGLQHWRRWRVLWLGWRGQGNLEIRFERAVVEGLLAAWARDPHSVVPLLSARRAKRESRAPWPSVPKTLSQKPPQLAETAGAPNSN
jgi:hypothetical protein